MFGFASITVVFWCLISHNKLNYRPHYQQSQLTNNSETELNFENKLEDFKATKPRKIKLEFVRKWVNQLAHNRSDNSTHDNENSSSTNHIDEDDQSMISGNNKDLKTNWKQYFRLVDLFRNYYYSSQPMRQDPTGKEIEEYFKNVKNNRTEVLQKIVNPHPFDYITNCPDICKRGTEEEEVFLLIFVETSIANHERREAIRKSWGRTSNYGVVVHVVFLCGKPKEDKNDTLQNALYQEQAMHKDIVQEEFIDTYNNLTYKTISGLKWVTHYCRQAKYTLKIDDDIFVNMFNLLNILMNMTYHPSYIMGNVRYRDMVLRSGRYKVAMNEFSPTHYPIYTTGAAYVISTALVEQLYFASYHVPFFRIEDVYTVGFLPKLIDPFPKFVQWSTRYIYYNTRFISSFTGPSWKRYLFSHVSDKSKYSFLWRQVLSRDQDVHKSLATDYKRRNSLVKQNVTNQNITIRT